MGAREYRTMIAAHTATIQRNGAWWFGWLEDIPGVNGQGRTYEELMESLYSALLEALEMERASHGDHDEAHA